MKQIKDAVLRDVLIVALFLLSTSASATIPLPGGMPFTDKAILLKAEKYGMDRVGLIAGKLQYIQTAQSEGYKPAASIAMTALRASSVYDYRVGISAYQLMDQTENQLRRAGYQVVYRCQGAACGELDGWKVFLGRFVAGSETSQYYLLARKNGADMAVNFVAIYVNDIHQSPRLIINNYDGEIDSEIAVREEYTFAIPFAINSAELTAGGRAALRRFVGKLSSTDAPQVKSIQVSGFTDAQGTAIRNKELSRQRAEVVASWLRAETILRDVTIETRFGDAVIQNEIPKNSPMPSMYRKAEIKIVRGVGKSDADKIAVK